LKEFLEFYLPEDDDDEDNNDGDAPVNFHIYSNVKVVWSIISVILDTYADDEKCNTYR